LDADASGCGRRAWIVEKLKQGYKANGKEWRIHPDGYNFMPYFKGEVDEGPREEIFYFGQGGEFNAIRWQDWKLSFALLRGNMATAIREIPAWPEIVNLRADPFEQAPEESAMYMRWMIDNMWLFVPIAAQAEKFLKSIPEYPYQVGANFSLADVSYRTFMVRDALKQLERLEALGNQ
jgi:arylsulfatase